MATDVQICSNALMLLGDKPIASLTEKSNSATLCANLYPLARRDILRKHVWNCAVTRVRLPALAGAPAFGWAHWFAKPGDFIRLLGIDECCPGEYAFEGNRILADATSLQLRYVADVTEGAWDASLTDVMIRRMASDLAYPITKSTSLAQLEEQEYRDALKIAKTIDGQEDPPQEFGDSPFLAARARGY